MATMNAFEEARNAFKEKIKISDAKDEHGNPKREEYYMSGVPSRAVEEHKDTVKRLYEVSLCALSADDTCVEQGVYSEAAERFWESVKPRAQLLTILMLLDSVKAHSKIWIDFLQPETVDRGRLAGLDDRSLPLRDHDIRDRMRAYEGSERDKCLCLSDDFLSRQVQVCAVKFSSKDPDYPEAYYEDRSNYSDKGRHLPLLLKSSIGSGATGEVFRVKFPREHFADYNDKELAMKVFRAGDGGNDAGPDSNFDSEWKHSKFIRRSARSHSSILTACAALKLEKGHGGLLFFPLADHNLWRYMETHDLESPAAYEEKKIWIQEMANIVDALSFLHEKGRFHGDVKSENILVFNHAPGTPGGLKLKLTDFGINSGREPPPTSYVFGGVSSVRPGSIGDDCSNRPPKEHRGQESKSLTAGRDIWGYGTALAEVISWLQGKESLKSFERKRKGNFPNDQYWIWEDGRRPKLRKAVPEWFDALAGNLDGSLNQDTIQLYKGIWKLLKDRIFLMRDKDRARAEVVYKELLKTVQSADTKGSSLWPWRRGNPGLSVDERTPPPDHSTAYASFCQELQEFGSPSYDACAVDHFASVVGHYDSAKLEQFLVLAMKARNFAVVNLLAHLRFAHDANIFHRAVDTGDVQFLEKLLKEHRHEFPSASKHLDSPDSRGSTPLLKAIGDRRSVRDALVRHLLELGADADKSDNQGQTPLHYAARKAAPTVIQALLSVGADFDKADKLKAAPLHLCAEGIGLDPNSGAVACTRLLIEAGADKKKQDKAHDIPLQCVLDLSKALTPERWAVVRELCRNTTNERNQCEQYVKDVFEDQPRDTKERCWKIWHECNPT
jgi:serine/threonine protein kinase